jgi:hypothetical protein
VSGAEHFVRAWGRLPESPCESAGRQRCAFWAACRREPIACGAFLRFVRGGRAWRSPTDIPTPANYADAMRVEA